MADRDRDPDPDDATPSTPSSEVAGETTSSAYAPPERRPGFWRNPTMVAVVAIVVVALLVYVVFLLLD